MGGGKSCKGKKLELCSTGGEGDVACPNPGPTDREGGMAQPQPSLAGRETSMAQPHGKEGGMAQPDPEAGWRTIAQSHGGIGSSLALTGYAEVWEGRG